MLIIDKKCSGEKKKIIRYKGHVKKRLFNRALKKGGAR